LGPAAGWASAGGTIEKWAVSHKADVVKSTNSA
jgi:hypothetical protein